MEERSDSRSGMVRARGRERSSFEEVLTSSFPCEETGIGGMFGSPMIHAHPTMAWKPLNPRAPKKSMASQENHVPDHERNRRRNLLGKHGRLSDASFLTEEETLPKERWTSQGNDDVEMSSPPLASRRRLESFLDEAANARKVPRLRERRVLEEMNIEEVCAIGQLSIYDNSATGLDPSVPLSPIRWPVQKSSLMPDEPRKSRLARSQTPPTWEIETDKPAKNLRRRLHIHEYTG